MSVNITYLEVEPDGEGCLLVRWELDEPAAVDISWGRTPVALEHRPALRVPEGTGSARLSGLSPCHRHYVSVAPQGLPGAVVVGERRVPFAGAINFRDLGGYRTVQGVRTKWGRVFRSDGLHRLTSTDLKTFNQLGIRIVYDLRGNTERTTEPDLVESVQVALLDWYTSDAGPSLLSAAGATEAERVLHRVYVGMLSNCAPLFGDLLSSLTDPDNLPAVIHCAGGKDRTGMVAALLLGALGVERSAVLDDYELTARWQTPDNNKSLLDALVGVGIKREAAQAFLGSPRWAMAEALDWLDRTYGGPEAYLLGPAGMAEQRVLELRRALTG